MFFVIGDLQFFLDNDYGDDAIWSVILCLSAVKKFTGVTPPIPTCSIQFPISTPSAFCLFFYVIMAMLPELDDCGWIQGAGLAAAPPPVSGGSAT